MKHFNWELFKAAPVMAIMRGYPDELLISHVKAAFESGLFTFEIALNAPKAFQQLEILNQEFGDSCNIGAGTVLTIAQLDQVQKLGATYIVSPVFNPEMVLEAKKRGLVVIPGAFTPTEIYSAWNLGADIVKVFPASRLGPTYIKEVLAPLNGIKLLPTGGITRNIMKEYFEAGAFGLGISGALFDRSIDVVKINAMEIIKLCQPSV